jgi:hypothetical protein
VTLAQGPEHAYAGRPMKNGATSHAKAFKKFKRVARAQRGNSALLLTICGLRTELQHKLSADWNTCCTSATRRSTRSITSWNNHENNAGSSMPKRTGWPPCSKLGASGGRRQKADDPQGRDAGPEVGACRAC